jgi:hypothetical protein
MKWTTLKSLPKELADWTIATLPELFESTSAFFEKYFSNGLNINWYSDEGQALVSWTKSQFRKFMATTSPQPTPSDGGQGSGRNYRRRRQFSSYSSQKGIEVL